MGCTSRRTERKASCNGAPIVVFILYRGYTVTDHCYATDVIDRYLVRTLPQWQSMMCKLMLGAEGGER
jgi:hypothetical protein